ncbi:MAG TPA: hypothetical protein VGL77_21235 [Armatimonadota bacterium]
MPARERILTALQDEHIILCDDCMVAPAALSARQVSYSTCTELAAQGQIYRGTGQCSLCGKGKLVNALLPLPLQAISHALPPASPATSLLSAAVREFVVLDRPWHWEGNVQAHLIAWLVNHGYAIRSVADTASRSPGKDIIAVGADRQELWVSVKGYPAPDKHPNTQARHWFSQAIFDALLYRDENPDVQLAVAFPGEFETYRALAKRMGWLRAALPFTIYWVMATGEVASE